MTFDSPDAYVEFWTQHPALDNGRWNEDLEDYVRYDLGPDGAASSPRTPCGPTAPS